MNNLHLIERDGKFLVDSRQVAEMVGVRHGDLLCKIDAYTDYLFNGKFRSMDFFVQNTYVDSIGRTLPCYLLTRKGCDMIANKMTGEKGVLFTAAYVTKFEEMEKVTTKPVNSLDVLSGFLDVLKQQDATMKQLQQEQTVITHRLNTMDKITIEGDGQQQLVKMVKKYAMDKGVTFQQAWKDFRQAYNTAYRTNITAIIDNYKDRHGLKDLTAPQYLSINGQIADGLRVADKMLNVSP